MICKLTVKDSELYKEHLIRTYKVKGILSDKDEKWIETGEIKESESPEFLLSQDWFHAWGAFDNGNIVQSISCAYFNKTNTVLIRNYKSELPGLFNPPKEVSPFLEESMGYFENLGVYNFYTVRKKNFFEWRKNLFYEDIPPLNRYNCYIEEVIPANSVSKIEAHKVFANYNIFDCDTVVAKMSLKQELRKLGPNKDITIIPNTKEMYDKFKNKNS